VQVLDTSSVEETPGPKLVNLELQSARETLKHTTTPGGPVLSVTFTANNAPAGLTAVDNFQATYLQPLKIFDTAIEKIANVWVALFLVSVN
jgi:hypothetical protein